MGAIEGSDRGIWEPVSVKLHNLSTCPHAPTVSSLMTTYTSSRTDSSKSGISALYKQKLKAKYLPKAPTEL